MHPREHPALAVSIAALTGTYLLQAATPLRLDDDAVDYMSMAAALADGRPVPRLPMPVGLPVVLSILDRAGLGASAFFVLTNCLFLGLGLYAIWQLREYPIAVKAWTVVVSLLAIPVVKAVPIALPEAVFFGLSSLALWAMTTATRSGGGRRAALLLAAFALSAAATFVRTIGLALLVPLAWSVIAGTAGGNDGSPNPVVLLLVVTHFTSILAGTCAMRVGLYSPKFF